MSEDLNSLLDGTLDDIADLPEFKPFPPGAHKVLISLDLKEINKKPCVEMSLKAMGTLELADPTKSEPIKEGDEASVLYFLDNEFGLGNLKKDCKPIGIALGTDVLREIIDGTKGMECVVLTSYAKNKSDPEKPYMNIKELQVV